MRTAHNVPYGKQARQTLDIYAPHHQRPRCRIVFVYGGSWMDGSKQDYGFVGAQLAKRGYQVIIPDYRLYPDVVFPAFVEDIALSIAALDTLPALQNESLPLILMGHSAGGLIAALLTFDKTYLNAVGLDPSNIAGLVSIAGPHDRFLPTDNPKWTPIFGTDKNQQVNALPINHVHANLPPTLILHGDADAIVNPNSAKDLTAKLKTVDVEVSLKMYPGIGHKRIVAAFGQPLHFLAPTLKDISEFLDNTVCVNHSN
jgi:acetyl esterase/lipase